MDGAALQTQASNPIVGGTLRITGIRERISREITASDNREEKITSFWVLEEIMVAGTLDLLTTDPYL